MQELEELIKQKKELIIEKIFIEENDLTTVFFNNALDVIKRKIMSEIKFVRKLKIRESMLEIEKILNEFRVFKLVKVDKRTVIYQNLKLNHLYLDFDCKFEPIKTVSKSRRQNFWFRFEKNVYYDLTDNKVISFWRSV